MNVVFEFGADGAFSIVRFAWQSEQSPDLPRAWNWKRWFGRQFVLNAHSCWIKK